MDKNDVEYKSDLIEFDIEDKIIIDITGQILNNEVASANYCRIISRVLFLVDRAIKGR